MTLAVLVLSEIIPKTLGAKHWRKLAPSVGVILEKLTWLMTPLVWLIRAIGGSGHSEAEFSREELKVMADIGRKEGKLHEGESRIIKNLLRMRDIVVADVMTPRVVVFSLPEETKVAEFVRQHEEAPFSRIPLFRERPDNVTGFVLRDDVLLAASKDRDDESLSELSRPVHSVASNLQLTTAFDEMISSRHHVALVMDEYGGLAGLLTLEDIVETLIGLEIVDEADTKADMQEFARAEWRKRARRMGLRLEPDSVSAERASGEATLDEATLDDHDSGTER